MKIFTKMKHALLAIAAMCYVGTAFAVDVTGSYAVVAGDVASDNQVTSVDGITLTFGTEATWKTGSAEVTVESKTFTLYATGDNGPSPKDGNVPTSGVYVVFEPEHDGTITAVVQNAGNGKNGYIVEDESQNLVNGTVLIDGVETAWTSGTPFNSAATYSGGVTFNVKAGSKYYFYLSGSKMRFMGFFYTYDDGYEPVWRQDFEDANTFNEGFVSGNTGRYEVLQADGYKTGSKALEFSYISVSGNNGATNTFTPPTELRTALETFKDEYQFDFYYRPCATSSDKNSKNGAGIKIYFDCDSIVTLLANKNSDAYIVVNGDSLVSLPNKQWCRIYINTNQGKTWLTITNVDASTTYVKNVEVANCVSVISKIENPTQRYWSEVRFDDMTLSAPGAKEEISAPFISVTKVNGINRLVTIEPGEGTVGTVADVTYYTLDGTDPSKENGIQYTEPIGISATTTFKAISYLPDGTASEITSFEAEAGTEVSLSKEIINVIGFEENGNVLNVIVGNVYNKDLVFLSPEVELTVTFNGTSVDLPYTVTEDGIIAVTATAEGYVSTSEEYLVNAAYKKIRYVDFATTTTENLAEFENGRWTIKDTNIRWGNWDKTSGDIYNTASLSDEADGLMAGDFLQRATSGTLLLVGYGLGRHVNSGTKTEFRIANPSDGQIVLYEMNESLKLNTTSWKPYYVMYADDNKMSCQADGTQVLAKVSLYTPVRELVVTDGTDFAPKYDYYTSATYTRSIAAGKYGTICLPFAPDAASLEAYNFYELTASTIDGTEGTVTFTKVDAPEANKPYIYCLADGSVEGTPITCGATEVSAEAGVTSIGDWQMVGSLTNQTVDCTGKSIYALSSANHELYRITNTLTVPPYRAYIEGTSGSVAPQMLTVRIGGPTGIEQISASDVEGLLPATIYDLMGRPVQNPQKGHLYIQGGKKVIKN